MSIHAQTASIKTKQKKRGGAVVAFLRVAAAVCNRLLDWYYSSSTIYTIKRSKLSDNCFIYLRCVNYEISSQLVNKCVFRRCTKCAGACACANANVTLLSLSVTCNKRQICKNLLYIIIIFLFPFFSNFI